jgi:hypothetical protein
MPDPWSDIAASSEPGSDHLRRADASHPLELWWGRDHLGRCLFVLDGRRSAARQRLPELAGIEIASCALDAAHDRLVLTLLDHADIELFRALCSDLLRATADVASGDSVSGLRIVLERLRRWQDLLRRRRIGLSDQEIIGLVGELLFLRDCLLTRVPASIATTMWRGPFGDEQDFLINGSIIEVKTQLATADQCLQISSENQLDTASGPILVVHQTISQSNPQSSSALSLNDLAGNLRAMIAAADQYAADMFDAGLLAAGHAPLPAYAEPYWLLAQRNAYAVGDSFPRIVPSDLRSGVERVRYHIRLETCLDHRVDLDSFLGSLFDGG